MMKPVPSSNSFYLWITEGAPDSRRDVPENALAFDLTADTIYRFTSVGGWTTLFASVGNATVNSSTFALTYPTATQFRNANGLQPGVDLQAYSVPLTALAGNTTSTLDFSNVGATFASLRLAAGPQIMSGSGDPNTHVTAPLGSLYFRQDGAVGVAVYVKEVGAGNTGWNPVVTATNGQYLYGGTAINDYLSLSGALLLVTATLTGTGAIGAIDLTKFCTKIVTTGAATATLAAGTDGQLIRLYMTEDGGDLVLTVTNLQGGTTLTFGDVDDFVDLQYMAFKWRVLRNNGVTLA